MSKIDELRLGFETAYIDGSVVSNNIYRPQFVSNNHKEGKKVISSIEDELLKYMMLKLLLKDFTQKDIFFKKMKSIVLSLAAQILQVQHSQVIESGIQS